MRLGYLAATAIQSGGSFLIVALLTRVLGASEYGRWALIEPLLILGAQVVFGGLSWGIVKLIAHDRLSPLSAIHSAARFGLFPAVLASALLGMTCGWWQTASSWWPAFTAFLLFEGICSLLLSACRGANFANGYLVGVTLRTGSLGALLVLCHLKPPFLLSAVTFSACWGGCSALAAFTTYLLLARKSTISVRLSISESKEAFSNAVRYGAPIMLAAVLAFVVANGDRFILNLYVTHAVIGDYAVLAKAAAALNLLVTPINLWWPTTRFQRIRDDDHGAHYFSTIAMCMCTGLGFAAGLVFLISPLAVEFFSPHASYSMTAAGALSLSAFFIAMSPILNIGTLKEGKTHWSVITVGAAAVVQVVTSLILVPWIGIEGAAFSAALSSFASLVFQNVLSQRIHFVPFLYRRMAAFIIAYLMIAAACVLFIDSLVIRCAVFVVISGPLLVNQLNRFRLLHPAQASEA